MRLQLRYLGLCLVVGIGVVLALPARVGAQGPTPLDEYRAAVTRALALATEAGALQPAERASRLADAASVLEAITTVQTPSGALVPINNSDLLTLLRDPSETESAISRLTALRDALSQPLTVVTAEELAALARILDRAPIVASSNWYDQWLRELSDFFDGLLGDTASGIFDARGLFVLLAVVAVAAIIAYFVRGLRRSLVAEEILPPELGEQEPRTPAAAFDSAQRFINAGDYRSAVRQLYLATLLLLDQRGRIKYDPTLTNREYLQRAARDPRTSAALQPIVETFDRTWYGFEPLSPEEFAAYRQRVEQVRDL